MRYCERIVLLLALIYTGHFAHASESADTCIKIESQNQRIDCYVRKTENAKKAVGVSYEKLADLLIKKKDKESIQLLNDSQLLWGIFQEKQCELEVSHAKGRVDEAIAKAICEQQLYTTRAKELSALLAP